MMKRDGIKTAEHNSRSMSGKTLCALLFASATLMAAPDRKIALEEIRLEVFDLSHQLKGQKSEIDLLNDQIHTLQSQLEGVKNDNLLAAKSHAALDKEKGSSMEKRVEALEKSNKSLASDLKVLKDHLNTQSETLTKCESKLSSLDAQLSSDIRSLKSTLQSMVVLMQGGEKGEKVYVVQPGDSLGKIACDHHVSVKTLKELNQLSGDQIVVGQKLLLSK